MLCFRLPTVPCQDGGQKRALNGRMETTNESKLVDSLLLPSETSPTTWHLAVAVGTRNVVFFSVRVTYIRYIHADTDNTVVLDGTTY